MDNIQDKPSSFWLALAWKRWNPRLRMFVVGRIRNIVGPMEPADFLKARTFTSAGACADYLENRTVRRRTNAAEEPNTEREMRFITKVRNGEEWAY